MYLLLLNAKVKTRALVITLGTNNCVDAKTAIKNYQIAEQ